MTKHLKITKEWLHQQYIDENKNIAEIADDLNVNKETIRRKIVSLGIEKSIDLINKKRSQTNLNKYGFENQFQVPEIKEKSKQTNLNKYGVENPIQSKEIRLKANNTIKEKYGDESPLRNLEIINKVKQTNLKKYGVETVSQAKSVKEKVQLNKIEKGFSTLFFGKTPKEWAREYNIPATNLYSWLDKNQVVKETDLLDYLNNYQKDLTDIENIISNELKLELCNKYHSGLKYKPDFKLSDKLYLNVDGLHYHSELFKNNDYHFQMRKDYEQLGLRIFQFRANEINDKLPIIKSMINNALNKTELKVGARKTKILKVNSKDAELFLNDNHIKGYKHAKHLGLYYQNELVSLMSYKNNKNRKTKKPFLDVVRFCSKTNYNVVGAFNKLMKPIMEEVGNLPIHYWVDLRYGTGTFLLSNGFKVEKETLGWEWTDRINTYNRLRCRANMDERKLSEKEHAVELNWVRIFDAGQRLYIKN